MSFSRRTLLKASAASAVLGGIGAPFVARAQTAEFTYKYANNLPDAHPMNVRAKEMAAAIKTETNGRFDLQIFPNNQLGSDTDMLSQIRSGGVEFFTLSGLILATLVPAASINGIGFAFPDYDTVWKAMDGDLGAYVRGEISQGRSRGRWTRSGTTASARPRRRPSRSTVPTISRASRSACRSRRSGPRCSRRSMRRRPRSISARSIRRCRPRSSRARKIRWPSSRPQSSTKCRNICSLTNHMWDGFWFLANRRAWEKLPEDVRAIVAKNINAAARQGARRRRQAECRPAAGTGRQGPGRSTSRMSRRSARNCAPPASMPSGRANTATQAWALLEKAVGKLS